MGLTVRNWRKIVSTIEDGAVHFSAVQCSAMNCSDVQYNTVQWSEKGSYLAPILVSLAHCDLCGKITGLTVWEWNKETSLCCSLKYNVGTLQCTVLQISATLCATNEIKKQTDRMSLLHKLKLTSVIYVPLTM